MQQVCKDTARDKWCSMTHTRIVVMLDPAGAQAPQQMRFGEAEQRKSNCMAGACMAWLWDGPEERFGRCGLVTQGA